jgi:hypothetical protein
MEKTESNANGSKQEQQSSEGEADKQFSKRPPCMNIYLRSLLIFLNVFLFFLFLFINLNIFDIFDFNEIRK